MNDFSGKNRELSEELKNDIERIRGEFGKGMGLDAVSYTHLASPAPSRHTPRTARPPA